MDIIVNRGTKFRVLFYLFNAMFLWYLIALVMLNFSALDVQVRVISFMGYLGEM